MVVGAVETVSRDSINAFLRRIRWGGGFFVFWRTTDTDFSVFFCGFVFEFSVFTCSGFKFFDFRFSGFKFSVFRVSTVVKYRVVLQKN